VKRYKARLVARGFQQAHGQDYDEMFAHVAHMTSIGTLIVVAAGRSWNISQMDVKNAFLHGDLCNHLLMLRPHLVMFVVFERLSMGSNKPLMVE
jgi:hypothetical protein